MNDFSEYDIGEWSVDGLVTAPRARKSKFRRRSTAPVVGIAVLATAFALGSLAQERLHFAAADSGVAVSAKVQRWANVEVKANPGQDSVTPNYWGRVRSYVDGLRLSPDIGTPDSDPDPLV